MEERYRRSSNSNRLGELASKAVNLISDTVGPGLEDLQRVTSGLRQIDPAIVDLAEEVECSVAQMQELERSVVDYLDDLEIDPSEVQEVEERFNLVESLKRKYGPTLQDALDHAENARLKLEGSDNREEFLARLKQDVDQALKKLRTVARKISSKRKKHAPSLA